MFECTLVNSMTDGPNLGWTADEIGGFGGDLVGLVDGE